jgi:hypothetical protein
MGWSGLSRPVVPAERVGDGAQGWNIDYGRLNELVAPSTPGICLPSGGGCSGWERMLSGVVGGSGTLLGPEGTAGRLLSHGRYARCSAPVGAGWCVGGCGLVPLGRTAGIIDTQVWVVWVGAGVRVLVSRS